MQPAQIRLRRAWRWFRFRGLALVVVFVCGLGGFELGVGSTAHPDLPAAGFATQFYYALGLFVLGGLDLGLPEGGPPFARAMLWFAYFAAPTITASAVVEGVLRAINPESWRLRRLRGHIVVAGCGRLGMLFLRRLRERNPTIPVVMIERNPDGETEDEARDALHAEVVNGDAASEAVLDYVQVDRAHRVLLLTGDDVSNLDAAAQILKRNPSLGSRVVVHVGDLRMMHVVATTHVAKQCRTFNTHRVAARTLVETRLAPRFERTRALDIVVIAGFGRFGQTVLDELQKSSTGSFEAVAILDVDAEARARAFEEEVGFAQGYRHEIIDGDVLDPACWSALEERVDLSGEEPAFVLACDDDRTNLRTALWLSSRFPKAFIVARSFHRSPFAEEVARERGFETFSVAELLAESMPDEWFE